MLNSNPLFLLKISLKIDVMRANFESAPNLLKFYTKYYLKVLISNPGAVFHFLVENRLFWQIVELVMEELWILK